MAVPPTNVQARKQNENEKQNPKTKYQWLVSESMKLMKRERGRLAARPGREMEGTNRAQQIKQEQPRFTVSPAQHGPARTYRVHRTEYMDQDTP